MPPLLPPDPSDVTNELSRRIKVLEDSMRRPGTGGYVVVENGSPFGGGSVVVSNTWQQTTLFDSPSLTFTVPPSGRFAVLVSMQASIGLPASGAGAYGQLQGALKLTGANTLTPPNIGIVSGVMYLHEYKANVAGLEINMTATLAKTIAFSNMVPGPTTVTILFRAFTDHAGSPIFGVSDRTMVVIPL